MNLATRLESTGRGTLQPPQPGMVD